jgi:hypothetical protein
MRLFGRLVRYFSCIKYKNTLPIATFIPINHNNNTTATYPINHDDKTDNVIVANRTLTADTNSNICATTLNHNQIAKTHSFWIIIDMILELTMCVYSIVITMPMFINDIKYVMIKTYNTIDLRNRETRYWWFICVIFLMCYIWVCLSALNEHNQMMLLHKKCALFYSRGH